MASTDESIEMVKSKEVMTALCASASTEVRNCLRKFKYGKEHTYKEQYSSIFCFSKSAIVDTLMYLGCNNEWKSVRKPECTHELVCRIQNLLPEHCGICNELYCVPKEQCSLLACAKCGQEAHRNCLMQLLKLEDDSDLSAKVVNDMINPLGLDSFIYLCAVCKDNVVPRDPVCKKSATCSRNENTVTVKEDNSKSLQKETPDVEHAEINNDVTPAICSFLKNGTCKHGVSGKKKVGGQCCQFTHLPLCKKFMNYGDKDKRGCKSGCNKLHPKLCAKSLSKNGCHDNQCSTFYHARKLKHFVKTISNTNGTRKQASVAKTQAKVKTDQTNVPTENPVDFLGLLSSFRADLLYQMDLKLATLMSQHQANVQRNVVQQKGTHLAVPSHPALNLQQGNNCLQWPTLTA